MVFRPTTARRSGGLVLLIAGLVLAAGALPASAVTTTQYATFGVLGSGIGGTTGSVVLSAFPAVSLTSTATTVNIPSGASSWLARGTAMGAAYGSSRGMPYLSISLGAGGGPTRQPSVTTYRFATPAPPGGWSFTLGDVDSESLRIAATAADGSAVPGSAFSVVPGNACDLPAGPGCDPAKQHDTPRWAPDAGGGTLDNREPDGSGPDTDGAIAMFTPTVALASLTVTSSLVQGSPTYQTWFADRTRSIGATVYLDGAPTAGATVAVQNAAGTTVATGISDPTGAVALPDAVAAPGYTLVATAPAGSAAPAVRVPFDLSAADAVLTARLATPAAPTPTGSPSASPAPSSTAPEAPVSELPATGGPDPRPLAALGGMLLVTGILATHLARPADPQSGRSPDRTGRRGRSRSSARPRPRRSIR